MTPLQSLSDLPTAVATPRYDRDAAGVGIVHVGLGAFMRAHLAVYTDDALAAEGGDWRITAIGLRSRDAIDVLNKQNGLYTLVVRDAEMSGRVIGSIADAIHAPSDPAAVLAALAAPGTRIVTITITEKGYGIDPATGGLDNTVPAIAADLASDLSAPQSAVGLIVAGLERRRAHGVGPFTALSCDNLPENGRILKRLVLDFARRRDEDLADWIEANARFPSTMVDRITPPQTEKTRTDARALTGADDLAAIETEPFSQWVIEDDFRDGRPAWEKGGAVMVKDVHAYERMKLVMLNGTHSMLAYAGHVTGHRFVRDTMADPDLKRLIDRHMQTAAATLDAVPGIDLDQYRQALLVRFANPAIDHPTYQIAMDGTQKLPTRIFDATLAAMTRGADFGSFAFATAAWMAYVKGAIGGAYAIRDPREAELLSAASSAQLADGLLDALLALPGLVPTELRAHETFRQTVLSRLRVMLGDGMGAAIAKEAAAL